MLTKLLCEFGATALMIIFGVGVHCDTVLKGTKYQGSGLMYADEFKASDGVVDPIAQRNIFSTNPTTEGTNYARNFFCEAICTFVFISAILAAANRAGENVLMLAICVGLIVWAVGMGMGGITGFAMNQARDLGPRMAYQVLPIKNKADNNWKYGLLVPGSAPFVGAALAALFVHGFLGMF